LNYSNKWKQQKNNPNPIKMISHFSSIFE